MAEQIVVGDVVRFIGGGSPMTVAKIEGDEAICVFSLGGKERLKLDVLEKVSEEHHWSGRPDCIPDRSSRSMPRGRNLRGKTAVRLPEKRVGRCECRATSARAKSLALSNTAASSATSPADGLRVRLPGALWVMP